MQEDNALQFSQISFSFTLVERASESDVAVCTHDVIKEVLVCSSLLTC